MLALAGLAAGVGWWFGAGPGARVTIADVRGDTVEAARLILEDQGAIVDEAVVEAFDLEIAAGLVAGTDPAAGEVIDRDTVVTIVVSRGPEPTTVPDVVGQPEADARIALVGAGFEVGEGIPQFEAAQAALSARDLTGIVGGASEFDNEVALGNVLRLERTTDGPVRPGSTLTIIVSRGPDLVEVPDVVGRSIDEAVEILEAAGYRVILDTTVPPGLRDSPRAPVQSTNPAVGERALRNSDVTVVANY